MTTNNLTDFKNLTVPEDYRRCALLKNIKEIDTRTKPSTDMDSGIDVA